MAQKPHLDGRYVVRCRHHIIITQNPSPSNDYLFVLGIQDDIIFILKMIESDAGDIRQPKFTRDRRCVRKVAAAFGCESGQGADIKVRKVDALEDADDVLDLLCSVVRQFFKEFLVIARRQAKTLRTRVEDRFSPFKAIAALSVLLIVKRLLLEWGGLEIHQHILYPVLPAGFQIGFALDRKSVV